MTYKKQQWKTGEIITEGKLNHIEDGIYNTDTDLTESKSLFANNILDLQTNKANQSDVVSINQEIDNISADLAAAEADIATKAAQADVDTISNEVDTLQTQVATNTNNIKSLQDGAISKSELDAKQDKLVAGSNITIENNIISATDTKYELPTASSTTLGGIKIGDNLSISEDGTLSATSGSSTPDNMVTTDTDQTITGSKTFKNPLYCTSSYCQSMYVGYGNDPITISLGGSEYNASLHLMDTASIEYNKNTRNLCISAGYNANILHINNYADGSSSNGTAEKVVISGNIQNKISGSTYQILTQNNVTAGDNISIENTSTGIKISSTGGGSSNQKELKATQPLEITEVTESYNYGMNITEDNKKFYTNSTYTTPTDLYQNTNRIYQSNVNTDIFSNGYFIMPYTIGQIVKIPYTGAVFFVHIDEDNNIDIITTSESIRYDNAGLMCREKGANITTTSTSAPYLFTTTRLEKMASGFRDTSLTTDLTKFAKYIQLRNTTDLSGMYGYSLKPISLNSSSSCTKVGSETYDATLKSRLREINAIMITAFDSSHGYNLSNAISFDEYGLYDLKDSNGEYISLYDYTGSYKELLEDAVSIWNPLEDNTYDNIQLNGNFITVPGITYQNLTSTTLNVLYKSPGNGYIAASFNSGGANQFARISAWNNTTDDEPIICVNQFSSGSSNVMELYCPINEDQYYKFQCNSNAPTRCRFIPLINK